MAKTFLRTKNVGSPCDSFSLHSGIAAQIRRTRRKCTSPTSDLRAFTIVLSLAVHGENRLSPSRVTDQQHQIRHLGFGTLGARIASNQVARNLDRARREIKVMRQAVNICKHGSLLRPLVGQE